MLEAETSAIQFLWMQVIRAGLEAAKEKGVQSISIPMVGAGNMRRDPVEMVHAIVKACDQFSRVQVQSIISQ